MVSNDANYPKMTQITGEGKESDSIPIVGQFVVGMHGKKTFLTKTIGISIKLQLIFDSG